MVKRALVVDDDRSMVRTLSDVLQLRGWEVQPAYSGADAVRAAQREVFDVVLMDVKMPGQDGVDAFKAMKRVRPGIRVVLMTAYTAPDRISEAEREGVVRVLAKPLNISALVTLLEDGMAGSRPVLIVDDDAAYLRTLSDVLRVQGYAVAEARDLPDATRLLATHQPIAVLLHAHLDDLTTRQTVSAVHSVAPMVAVILYSGRPGADREVRDALPASWIHTYLQKPFVVEQVAGVLDGIRP